MPRFAANVSLMYTDMPFLDRFEAAHEDGFKFVECLFPYEHDSSELKKRLAQNRLEQVLINTPPAGCDGAMVSKMWNAGMRGVACLPGHELEFKEGFELALRYATALGCGQIHAMAGCVPQALQAAPQKHQDALTSSDISENQGPLLDTYLDNLFKAANMAAQEGIDVLIEPINTRDIPNYFLNRQSQAHAIVETLGLSNLKVQMDLYHCQIVEGDLIQKIKHYLPTGRVAHIQVAGVPSRQELHLGELNYVDIFQVLDELALSCQWQGYVGLEYRPQDGAQPGGTSRGLSWLKTSVNWQD